MNKRRVCTTISAKHWELLKKYTAKYETQQKTLEFALEGLENDLKTSPLSPEEQLWMSLIKARNVLSIIHRDLYKEFIKTADPEKIIEAITRLKLGKYTLESYYNKPIKNCNLKQVMDGLVITGRMVNWYDSVDYIDNGSHYTLRILHSLGINNSKITKIFLEDLFKEYGVKIESEITDSGIFVKVYKSMIQ